MRDWTCPPSLANAIGSVVLAIGLCFMAYFDSWWPALALVLGASVFARQFLRRRFYDATITACIFGGLYAAFTTSLPWTLLMPVIFVVAAITNLFREITELRKPSVDHPTQQQLEEDLQEQHEHHQPKP